MSSISQARVEFIMVRPSRPTKSATTVSCWLRTILSIRACICCCSSLMSFCIAARDGFSICLRLAQPRRRRKGFTRTARIVLAFWCCKVAPKNASVTRQPLPASWNRGCPITIGRDFDLSVMCLPHLRQDHCMSWRHSA